MRGGEDGVLEAVAGFEKALRAEPASPYRWCDLGEAHLEAGEQDRARYCFARAVERAPASPLALLRAANFHFRAGESRQALTTAARVLAAVDRYDGLIFSSYAAMGGSLEEVLEYGVPAERRAAQAWFRFVLGRGEAGEAEKTWRWLEANGLTGDGVASEYVEWLAARRRNREAAELWAGHLGPRRGKYLASEFLFNGDFESEPTGARFDWRLSPATGCETQRVADAAASGRHSLRIRFSGTENVGFRHVSQAAWLPAGAYRLRARVRTEGITTDSGVALRVVDAEAGRVAATTEAVTGSSGGWREVETTFRAGPAGRAVTVEIAREPSLKIDNKIAGTLWVDAVSLARAGD